MKHAPSKVTLRDVTRTDMMVETLRGWFPARSEGFFGLKSRLQLALLVFIGKADAFVWPEDELKA